MREVAQPLLTGLVNRQRVPVGTALKVPISKNRLDLIQPHIARQLTIARISILASSAFPAEVLIANRGEP